MVAGEQPVEALHPGFLTLKGCFRQNALAAQAAPPVCNDNRSWNYERICFVGIYRHAASLAAPGGQFRRAAGSARGNKAAAEGLRHAGGRSFLPLSAEGGVSKFTLRSGKKSRSIWSGFLVCYADWGSALKMLSRLQYKHFLRLRGAFAVRAPFFASQGWPALIVYELFRICRSGRVGHVQIQRVGHEQCFSL